MTASDNTLTQVLQPLDVVDAPGADRVGYHQKVYCISTIVPVATSIIVTAFPMSTNQFVGVVALVLASAAWLVRERKKENQER